MKNFKTYMSLIFAGALALTACQDDFDDPGMVTPESSWLTDSSYELKTIEEIKTEYWQDADNYYETIGEGTDGKRLLVKGRVISSDASGNIYKSLVIQDETGALAMSINANSMCNQYRRGQELVIDLTGMTIGKYAGLQQLGSPEDSPQYGKQTTFMPYQLFVEHSQKNGLPDLAEVDTLTVNSLSQLSGGPEVLRKWQSQLVRFNNCYFAEGGTATFAESKETVNRTLTLSDGGTIVVRTSGYSNFYSTVLPEGHGDVVGLLSYHTSGGWQLLLLDRNGCMNFGNPTIGPGAEDNPYTVDQALSIITDGGTASDVWTTGYIVGAVAPGVTSVSSNSDIQFTAEPDLDNTLVIAQNPDCTDWTKCMLISLPQGSKLRTYGNLRDNKDNYKKQMWIKGNFGTSLDMPAVTGNNGSAGTFRIDGVEVPGGDEPSPGEGDGTQAKPYTVAQVIALGSPGSTAWVEGYIVGWVDGADITAGSHFEVPSTSASNVLIAATPDEKDYAKCVPVQLVSGTDIRSKVNLKDNPGNLGKKLKIEGSLEAYFRQPGIKAPTAFELSGEGGGDTPVGPTEGDGTQASPYSVTSAIALNNPGTVAWVQGYIVGWVEGADISAGSHFEVPSSSASNVLIAASATETDYTKCIPVQLVNGTDIRAQVNLKDNPGNLGKVLKIQGSLEAYFRQPGIKAPTAFELSGTTGGDTPDTPTPGAGAPDFNTMNNGEASGYYNTMTSATGWVAANAQLLRGGDTDASPIFKVFGDASVYAVCLNGKTSAIGTLTSPTLKGGIGTLKFDYCQPFSDNKCKLTINIKQNGSVVASDVLENNGMTKLQKYEYSHDFNVSGDFVIEIVNAGPSASTSNKDRTAIWNLTWSGK